MVLTTETQVKLSLVAPLIVGAFTVMNYLGTYATKEEMKEVQAGMKESQQHIAAIVDDSNRRIVRLDKRIDAILMRDGKRDASLEDDDLDSIGFGKMVPIKRNVMDRGL